MPIPSRGRAPSLHRSARRLLAALILLVTGVAPAREQPLPALPGLETNTLHVAPTARYVRTTDRDGRSRVTADFEDHGGAAMRVSFDLQSGASLNSMQSFGFSQSEVQALRDRCRREGPCEQADLDQRLKAYYRAHALSVREVPGKLTRLSVDIPRVVRQSRAQVQPLVAALRELGTAHGLQSDQLMGAATALVQGAMAYRSPAPVEDGRQTLGFYTPPRALEQGYGDCDTKSALLAAIRANLGEDRIIGVRVPDHYLLGVARPPRAGEVALEFRGEPYVLIEAAGPAQRRIGSIGKQTRVALAGGADIRIDPIF